VPDIRFYLISTSTLDNDNYHSHFDGDKWKFDMSLYITQVKLHGEINIIESTSTKL
jgi:hypothetical protein